jgi:hypothetical protein
MIDSRHDGSDRATEVPPVGPTDDDAQTSTPHLDAKLTSTTAEFASASPNPIAAQDDQNAVTQAPDPQAVADMDTHVATEPPAERSADDDWVKPGPVESSEISDGLCKGRIAVGDVGQMQRIMPRILKRVLGGGHWPEAMVDGGYVAERLYVGAVSLRGPAHHELEEPRQDHYSLCVEGDWFIGVVADGVSEAKWSHLAAERAAATAVRAIRARINPDGVVESDWPAIGEECRQQVRALAVKLIGRSVRGSQGEAVEPEELPDRALAQSFATTCDVVICRRTPDDEGTHQAVRATISGDGSAYVLSPSRGWKRVGTGKLNDQGVVDNSVTPLPKDPGPPRVTATKLRAGDALVLCTDGFGDLIEGGGRPVGRYLFKEWAEPLDPARLLRTASFVNVNADDDRTAIIVWALS